MNIKSKPLSLKELVPALYEPPKAKRERHKRVMALFKTPLFLEDVEEQRETGKALMKALAESREHKI